VIKIRRIEVVSSNLKSVGYDPVSAVLEIEFHGGSIYHYSHVPEEIYNGLMSADSHGEYFSAYIKHVYQYEKIR